MDGRWGRAHAFDGSASRSRAERRRCLTPIAQVDAPDASDSWDDLHVAEAIVTIGPDPTTAFVAKQAWRSGRLAGMKASALLSQKARRLSAQM